MVEPEGLKANWSEKRCLNFGVVKDRIDNKLYELLFHQSRENRGDRNWSEVLACLGLWNLRNRCD